jgi:polyisoprenoid-binding protein YceI
MSARLISTVLIAMSLSGVACDPRGHEASPDPASTDAKRAQDTGSESKRGDAGSEAANGTHYRVNPEKSRLTAQVGVGGMLKSLGHPHVIAIRRFGGEVETSSGMVGSASFVLKFDTGSLAEVGTEFSDKDRQKVNEAVRNEALEASKHPEAVFKSTQVTVTRAGANHYEASIRGTLNLHGATNEVTFPAKVRVEGNILHASGSFTILHSAYGIKRLSAAGGTIKAKDEIDLSFDIQADQD